MARIEAPFLPEIENEPTTAWFFQGQGFQRPGMGKNLYDQSPAARKVYDLADKILGNSITTISFLGPAEVLNQTDYTQPAVVTHSIAWVMAKQERQERGFTQQPTLVAGHSLGQITAFWAAEAIDTEDTIWIAGERGKAMQKAGEKADSGLILIHQCHPEVHLHLTQKLKLEEAIKVTEDEIVFGGLRRNLEKALDWLRNRRIDSVPVNVSAAFHTSFMEPALEPLAKALSRITIRNSQIPIISSLTGEIIQSKEKIINEFLAQLISPVQLLSSIKFIGKEKVNEVFEVPVEDKRTSYIIPRILKVLGGIAVTSTAVGAGAYAWQRLHHPTNE